MYFQFKLIPVHLYILDKIRWSSINGILLVWSATVYPKKYAHGFCFAVLCCGYTLTDFPISITSLTLWQSNDCPSASKATLMNMDKHFMWIHYERLRNHNKAKHNKTMCIFLGIYCMKCYKTTLLGHYIFRAMWYPLIETNAVPYFSLIDYGREPMNVAVLLCMSNTNNMIVYDVKM